MTPAALVAASSSGRNSGGTHSDAGGGSPRHAAAAAASAQALALLAAERARHADAEVRLQDALDAAQRDLQAQLALCARVQADAAVQVATERARVVMLEAQLEAALAGRGRSGDGQAAERLQDGVLALQEERDGLAAALEAALAEAASVRRQLDGGGVAEEAKHSGGGDLSAEVEAQRVAADALRVEVEQLHQALELEWQRNRQARADERREWVQKEALLVARVTALEGELQRARHG